MTLTRKLSDEVQSLTESREQEFIFVLKTAFLKDANKWRNCFSLLKLMRKRSEKLRSDKLDYENFVLEKRYLSLDEGLNFLQRLEDGELNVSGYAPRPIKGYNKQEFLGSGSTYGYLRAEWPTRFYQYYVEEDRSINIPREPLVNLDYPLFRNASEAISTFFDLEVTSSYFDFGNKGELWVLIPDYRARLRELRIRYTKVSTIIDTEYFDEKDLGIRVFAKSGAESFISPLLKLKDHRAEFDCKYDLDYVLVYLLSKAGEAIDFKEWNLSWSHRRDETIIVERPKEQIKDIIRRGEGLNLEFKFSIDDKQDFLETVVAFSNSSGGMIIVGVDNNGQVKGFRGNKEDILKTIHDSCEPPITPRFQSYDDIDGFPIMVLEIESGGNKPYLLKSNGIAYVRHGSNDFPPSRAELDQMYTKERPGYGL